MIERSGVWGFRKGCASDGSCRSWKTLDQELGLDLSPGLTSSLSMLHSCLCPCFSALNVQIGGSLVRRPMGDLGPQHAIRADARPGCAGSKTGKKGVATLLASLSLTAFFFSLFTCRCCLPGAKVELPRQLPRCLFRQLFSEHLEEPVHVRTFSRRSLNFCSLGSRRLW